MLRGGDSVGAHRVVGEWEWRCPCLHEDCIYRWGYQRPEVLGLAIGS